MSVNLTQITPMMIPVANNALRKDQGRTNERKKEQTHNANQKRKERSHSR